jgi:hypothetical protein
MLVVVVKCDALGASLLFCSSVVGIGVGAERAVVLA